MSPTTVSFRILRFHNCEGCIRKLGIALHHIDDVELLEFDPTTGHVTLSTSKHPEAIRNAIELKTKKHVIILSREINPRTQNPNFTGPHQGTNTINVQELAEALLRVSQAEGLTNVELVGDLNSNSFRLNFNSSSVNNYMGEGININADYEFLPPPPRTIVEPPVPPPFPTTGDQVPVYGYPPEFYGLCTTCSHEHKNNNRCCTIL